jgi:flagellar biosynthetic protein FliR
VITLELPQLMAWLGSLLWPLFRISAFFLVAPVIGVQLVSPRIRIGLALLMSMLVMPLLPPAPVVDPLSLAAALLIVQQLLIGMLMGFFMQMFFQVFVIGGQTMAMQMALGLASMVDPANGINVTVVAQFYLMLCTLVFIASNGHLLMFEVLVESFYAMPVGTPFQALSLWAVVEAGSWMFMSGLLLALPAVTALLVVNLAFGVMTRAAPQLNIFSLGFPVSMVFGLAVIWASLAGFLPKYDGVATYAFAMLRHLGGQ